MYGYPFLLRHGLHDRFVVVSRTVTRYNNSLQPDTLRLRNKALRDDSAVGTRRNENTSFLRRFRQAEALDFVRTGDGEGAPKRSPRGSALHR